MISCRMICDKCGESAPMQFGLDCQEFGTLEIPEGWHVVVDDEVHDFCPRCWEKETELLTYSRC